MGALMKLIMSEVEFIESIKDEELAINGLLIKQIHIKDLELTNKQFEECSFEGVIFEDVTLEDTTFENCQFKDCQFKHTHLGEYWDCTFENVDFSNSYMFQLDQSGWAYNRFMKCNFKGFRMMASLQMQDSIFEECNLSHTIFMISLMSNNRFIRSNMQDSVIIYGRIVATEFEEVDLRNAVIDGIFMGVDFKLCHLENATLIDVKLSYGDNPLDLSHFVECKLEGAKLGGKEAEGVVEKADKQLKDILWKGIRCKNSILPHLGLEDGTNLEGVNLVENDLEGANMKQANLKRANLAKANLVNVNMEKADLFEANLAGANLQNANLMGANLENANLENTNLKGTNLEGANLKGTILEKGRY